PAWLGVMPFFVFATAFLLLPVGVLLSGSFFDSATGQPTLDNYAKLAEPSIVQSYALSIEISLVTAVAGAAFGFLLAYALIIGGLPRFLRTLVMTFSGVASNFAGVPLALAFIYTLGFQGMFTLFLKNSVGINLYGSGFTLYTKLGIELAYMYFQFPLMVLIMAPALDGLKREWREAAENMGASPAEYWRHVALPILTPTILGTVILLFGNAFGAQATAYNLAPLVPIVTNVISNQISGDVFHNTGLGYALAMGMVVIMGIAIAIYARLQRISERWLKS
ncbi:MAG: putative spermidine/putrescine transport system permease protein, partial [Chloroflexota bacterium]|nr:putative spermidine/putrescine transport system permease protein [Chloroflexota bacterium]